MKIKLLSIEDGLNNTGFRKLAAYVKRLYPATDVYYVVTANVRSFKYHLLTKKATRMADADVERIAETIGDADVVGFSSMTQYAPATADIIAAIRRRNPKIFIVWGGIHPIIEPEEAIKHADGICTGEGEFAFEKFLKAFEAGEPYFKTPSFWFNTPEGIKKNVNLPLMTAPEMDSMPIPVYQDGEYLFEAGRGFAPIGRDDFLFYNGLAYKTLWSIGCPFKCTYCGNTKFIDYDKNYRKIRHSSPATIIAELKDAIQKHPHISSIVFDDDSFMALPMRVMEEFCELYRRDIGLPFVVTGLIPNYVREDKLALLVNAGMNRVRMGVQSGSEAILEFYDRPTPIARVKEAAAILNKFRANMIPPAFDIILDNPIEQVEDNRATLDLIYSMPRPYTLNIFSLRVIPNTRLAQLMKDRGINLDDIRSPLMRPQSTLSNMLVFAMVTFPLPRAVFEYFRARALPTHMPQPLYHKAMMLMRFVYLCKRAMDHVLYLDFTIVSSQTAVNLWRSGVLKIWQKIVLPRYAAKRALVERPIPRSAREPVTAAETAAE